MPMYLKEDHACYLLRDTLLFYVNIFSLWLCYGSDQSPQDASMCALICSKHFMKYPGTITDLVLQIAAFQHKYFELPFEDWLIHISG